MKIQKFGNSLAVYLSKPIAEALDWKWGDTVEFKLAEKGKALLVRKP